VDEGKLSLESKDIAEEKRQVLLRLFPEAQTEGGKIDFDQLKRALGESVDPGRERYGMNWPGKADYDRRNDVAEGGGRSDPGIAKPSRTSL
jgi:hypothetical protein